MTTKKLYFFYFCYGCINAVGIQMMPLFLSHKGFSLDQVTTLLSVVFIAALFQPVLGFITRHYMSSITMLKCLMVAIIITAFLMDINSQYGVIMLLILLFSVARLSISPIYDSYTTISCQQNNGNYGLIRSGASLGFGTGMMLYSIIAAVLGADINFSMIFIVILSFVGFILIFSLPAVEQQHGSGNSQDEHKTNLPLYILLVSIYALYFGALSLRITYLSSYYTEFNYSLAFISFTTFVMVIPEITIMPLYNRLFGRFNKQALLLVAVVLGLIQITMYTQFYMYPILLIITSIFNGLQIMIFFPTFFALLQDSLGPKNSAAGFLINMTCQSLFVGTFNQFVIKPAYLSSGTTLSIFTILLYLILASMIPLGIYHILVSRKHKHQISN